MQVKYVRTLHELIETVFSVRTNALPADSAGRSKAIPRNQPALTPPPVTAQSVVARTSAGTGTGTSASSAFLVVGMTHPQRSRL